MAKLETDLLITCTCGDGEDDVPDGARGGGVRRRPQRLSRPRAVARLLEIVLVGPSKWS